MVPVSYQYQKTSIILRYIEFIWHPSWTLFIHIMLYLFATILRWMVKCRPASNERLNIPACWKCNLYESKVNWNSRCCTKAKKTTTVHCMFWCSQSNIVEGLSKTTKFWLVHHMYITTLVCGWFHLCLRHSMSDLSFPVKSIKENMG